MEKNKLKQIVMISGITLITAISLLLIGILSNGFNKNIEYGRWIAIGDITANLLWVFISNIVINYRYKKLKMSAGNRNNFIKIK